MGDHGYNYLMNLLMGRDTQPYDAESGMDYIIVAGAMKVSDWLKNPAQCSKVPVLFSQAFKLDNKDYAANIYARLDEDEQRQVFDLLVDRSLGNQCWKDICLGYKGLTRPAEQDKKDITLEDAITNHHTFLHPSPARSLKNCYQY